MFKYYNICLFESANLKKYWLKLREVNYFIYFYFHLFNFPFTTQVKPLLKVSIVMYSEDFCLKLYLVLTKIYDVFY